MGSNLKIGNIDFLGEQVKNQAVSYLSSLGLVKQTGLIFKKPDPNDGALNWTRASKEIHTLDFLNEASSTLLLEFAAHADGFKDASEALEKTHYSHLPWWLDTVWLPVEFKDPQVRVSQGGVCLCSCQSLLMNLKELNRKSNGKFEKKPGGFDEMLADLKSFYKKAGFQLGENEVIPWEWNALKIGAEEAIRNQSPLILM